ncbi:cytochrome c6, chloroplastic [Rhodamnia argentea]|uniref:Cytochrome c-553 n=1 Tax=Rhodamnia argentea TaxID=178133 RepID=A0A8B8QQW2_9MYRT|nr:cytochrome c6, chloroplastic [Rhodamnia argentea]XP_048132007.1 cytochrome c6, chloroplastic [Rhodamnia argentea]
MQLLQCSSSGSTNITPRFLANKRTVVAGGMRGGGGPGRDGDEAPRDLKRAGFLGAAVAPPLVAAVVALSPLCLSPVSLGQTADIQRGAVLFRRACIGCHDSGGNIIQPGATLFMKDLQRNGVDTEEEIYRVTYFGKGRMPGFGENCTPRGQCTFGPRLQEEEIKELAKFVKLQADQGWPKIEIGED